MHNLKQRLEPIQLSKAQKQQIIANAKRQPKKQRSYIPIILPAFIALSVFFIMISITPNSWTFQQTTASTYNQSMFDHLSLAIILWSTVSSIELIIIYLVAKACIAHTVRWRTNEKIQEWNAFFSKPVLPKVVLFIAFVLLWIGTFCFASLWYSQLIFVILSVALITFLILNDARDRVPAHCPHCHVPFTRKQIWSKSFMAYREKCDECKQLIYLERHSTQGSIMYTFLTFIPITLHNMVDLHFVYVLLFCVLLVASLTYFCTPLLMQFTDKDTSMDDFKK